MFAEIKGQIERITYYNEENGYTIAKVKVVASAFLDTKTKNRIFLPIKSLLIFPIFKVSEGNLLES
jgi:hypothetical protein